MSYLITQSLIGSWNYMMSCRDECQEDAYADFLNTLHRVPKETTPEMRNGIDFENEVYKAAAGLPRTAHPKWEQGINAELAGKYLDSPQHPTYFFIEPDAREFRYLVSDGADFYTETYTRANSRPFKEIAEEFLTSLDAMNLLGVYKEKWAAR